MAMHLTGIPTLLSMSKEVDRALKENQALLAAAFELQNSGRIVSAAKVLRRLDENLKYVASVIEGSRTLPAGESKPLPPSGPRATPIAPKPTSVQHIPNQHQQ